MINGTCLNFCDYFGYDGPECGTKECSSDGDCKGTDPHCDFRGKCYNCESYEVWTGSECTGGECTSNSQCSGYDPHCYDWKCYSCTDDERWGGHSCDDIDIDIDNNILGIAFGIAIFLIVGIPLIIIASIVACCFCCLGCPGYRCKQRRVKDEHQTVFVATQIRQQHRSQESVPTKIPEARY